MSSNMVSGTLAIRDRASQPSPLLLGGYAAIAESAWMGAAQASDVLEPINVGRSRRMPVLPRVPRLRLSGIFTRQYSVAEASLILMASFFFSALLGAIRQILFDMQFGTGMDANAYYAL
ncbi:MAG TPA: hypothetical protein VF221_11745 [Chloroflexota bacterium]